jgi:hypothetical protein
MCPNCGHLDSAPFAHAEEALLRHALGRNIEIRMLTRGKLPPPDEIAAWLRFVARHNTPQAHAS